jgi:hypothetical protein
MLPGCLDCCYLGVQYALMLPGYLDCGYLGVWVASWLEEDRNADLLEGGEVAGPQQLPPDRRGQPLHRALRLIPDT